MLLYPILLAFLYFLNQINALNEKKWQSKINLPAQQMAPYFYNNRQDAARCRHDHQCPFKMHLDRKGCWGYEKNCSRQFQYSYPKCLGDHNGWVKSKAEQEETFFKQGDFGYIRERMDEMFSVCKPENPDQSSLKCTKYLRYCQGKDIFFNFTTLENLLEPIRYKMDIIREGQVGGHCTVDKEKLKEEGSQMSPLQSWAPELKHFTRIENSPSDICDVTVTEPTFILKLDATVNMYHHFCDFFNLYVSLHMNNTFTTNIRILIWDTMPYRSNFGVTWKAFTRHPVQDLGNYKGKTVCFRQLVLPFLPRMIFGMYYNMPLINGCEQSGLFHAFSHHVIHRLGIQQEVTSNKLRVTLLSRSTTYRKILNEDQLIKVLKATGEFDVKKVDFSWNQKFEDQLQITQNTDILVGIHGAGLTHVLFLPDWSAVFEIYNCEDPGCYHDLARLRGVRYFTWEKQSKLKPQDKGNHPTEGAHAKFTNYEFDPREFVRIVRKAAEHIRNHPTWKQIHSKQTVPQQHNEL